MPTKKRKPRGELNELHISILNALATCELLTIPHLNKLKLCSERHLRDKLKDLQAGWGSALIKASKSRGADGKKKPYYYHLTKHGKAVIAKVTGAVFDRVKIPGTYPKNGQQYQHRFQQIDVVVDLYRWANYNRIGIAFFDHYFDRTKGKKGIHQVESLTRLYLPPGSKQQYIEPDGVCLLETPKGEKLYLFELHRGYGVERLLEQIREHQVIIKEEIAMKKYGHERNNRVIVVCEKRATEAGILKRLKEEVAFRPYGNYFVFKNLEEKTLWEIEQFGGGRKNGLGEIVSLY